MPTVSANPIDTKGPVRHAHCLSKPYLHQRSCQTCPPSQQTLAENVSEVSKCRGVRDSTVDKGQLGANSLLVWRASAGGAAFFPLTPREFVHWTSMGFLL